VVREGDGSVRLFDGESTAIEARPVADVEVDVPCP
jgi:hypothetical protein